MFKCQGWRMLDGGVPANSFWKADLQMQRIDGSFREQRAQGSYYVGSEWKEKIHVRRTLISDAHIRFPILAVWASVWALFERTHECKHMMVVWLQQGPCLSNEKQRLSSCLPPAVDVAKIQLHSKVKFKFMESNKNHLKKWIIRAHFSICWQ